MLRVAADRAHDEREAAALRIEQPVEPVVLRSILEPGREPALDVLDAHEPDRAERALADERAGVARHRIRRVRVRDREDALLPSNPSSEIARLAVIPVTGLSQTTSSPASSAARAKP